MKEGKYRIIRDIPVGKDGNKIKAGLDLFYLGGVFYMDGGMLDRDFQEDFTQLLKNEIRNGWKYLKPIDVQ